MKFQPHPFHIPSFLDFSSELCSNKECPPDASTRLVLIGALTHTNIATKIIANTTTQNSSTMQVHALILRSPTTQR